MAEMATAGRITVSSGAGGGQATLSVRKIKNLTGPDESGRFGTPWTDLGIPVRCPDDSMLFVGGDSFGGPDVDAQQDWRAPVGLRSGSSALEALTIDGAVGGDHAGGLVEKDSHPAGLPDDATAIPSDVFRVGDRLYMHLMRGVIYRTERSDLWTSTDNGNTWKCLCQWPGDLYGGQFQQKTYAVADDGFCYVLSSVFNRKTPTGLLLHRVNQLAIGRSDAYEPWGFVDGVWDWGNPPTTILGWRFLGEICFRAIDGKYAFTFLDNANATIRCQVFDTPLADLTKTPEQTMIVNGTPETGAVVRRPYGGFIIPGSTLDDFHIVVSQWFDKVNYRVMQYQVSGLAH